MNPDEKQAEKLRELVNRAVDSGKARPLLHHLNADTTWLLQIPAPESSDLRKTGRLFFNLLIDPWLKGRQSDVASWFSSQWHAAKSSVQSISEVESMIELVERIVKGTAAQDKEYNTNGNARSSLLDAVVISHEFTDHCHRETLLEIDRNVPVFATTKAAELVKSWQHFSTVIEVPGFGAQANNWRAISQIPLPNWLAIGRLITADNSLYYHAAILIAFASSNAQDGSAEAVIYSPHGILPQSLESVPNAKPPIKTLAFLHGLHDVSLPMRQLNLGAYNGLEAQRLLNARYWIGTHDEVKIGKGFVGWILRRKSLTLGEAVDREKRRLSTNKEDTETLSDPRYFEVSNGQGVALLA